VSDLAVRSEPWYGSSTLVQRQVAADLLASERTIPEFYAGTARRSRRELIIVGVHIWAKGQGFPHKEWAAPAGPRLCMYRLGGLQLCVSQSLLHLRFAAWNRGRGVRLIKWASGPSEFGEGRTGWALVSSCHASVKATSLTSTLSIYWDQPLWITDSTISRRAGSTQAHASSHRGQPHKGFPSQEAYCTVHPMRHEHGFAP